MVRLEALLPLLATMVGAGRTPSLPVTEPNLQGGALGSCTIPKASFLSGMSKVASMLGQLQGKNSATGGGSCYNDAYDCSYYGANYYTAGNRYRADLELMKDCLDMIQTCEAGQDKQEDPCYSCQRLVLYRAMALSGPIIEPGDEDDCDTDSRADCYSYFAAESCYAAAASCALLSTEETALNTALKSTCVAWKDYRSCGAALTSADAALDACEFVTKTSGTPEGGCIALSTLLDQCERLGEEEVAPVKTLSKPILQKRGKSLGQKMATCVGSSSEFSYTGVHSQTSHEAPVRMINLAATNGGASSESSTAGMLATVSSLGVGVIILALFVAKRKRSCIDSTYTQIPEVSAELHRLVL